MQTGIRKEKKNLHFNKTLSQSVAVKMLFFKYGYAESEQNWLYVLNKI